MKPTASPYWPTPAKIDETGKEAGKGLAAAGGSKQKNRIAEFSGGKDLQLMPMRCPAAGGEPAGQGGGKGLRNIVGTEHRASITSRSGSRYVPHTTNWLHKALVDSKLRR